MVRDSTIAETVLQDFEIDPNNSRLPKLFLYNRYRRADMELNVNYKKVPKY